MPSVCWNPLQSQELLVKADLVSSYRISMLLSCWNWRRKAMFAKWICWATPTIRILHSLVWEDHQSNHVFNSEMRWDCFSSSDRGWHKTSRSSQHWSSFYIFPTMAGQIRNEQRLNWQHHTPSTLPRFGIRHHSRNQVSSTCMCSPSPKIVSQAAAFRRYIIFNPKHITGPSSTIWMGFFPISRCHFTKCCIKIKLTVLANVHHPLTTSVPLSMMLERKRWVARSFM